MTTGGTGRGRPQPAGDCLGQLIDEVLSMERYLPVEPMGTDSTDMIPPESPPALPYSAMQPYTVTATTDASIDLG